MFPRRPRRAAVLLLAILMSAQWAAADPPRAPAFRLPQVGSFWAWLAEFFQKAGCTIDPSSLNCKTSSQPQNNGCTLDSSDACAPAASEVDAGCTIDPDGRCIR